MIEQLNFIGRLVKTNTKVTDCRDPNDNYLLALALDGKADLLITGDKDLLVLHPWRDIPIVTPTDAVSMLTATP